MLLRVGLLLLQQLSSSPAAVGAAALQQLQPSSYAVSNAGEPRANGVYLPTESGATWVAASGFQLFLFEGSWYLGKSGTGPVFYEGGCPSSHPPANWTTYDWKGSRSKPPLPRIVAAGGAPPLSACAGPCDYTLSQAGAVAADGCYTRSAPAVFTRKGSAVALYRRATPGVESSAEWVVGVPGGSDLYTSNCNSSTLPPADAGWHANAAVVPIGQHKPPRFSATVAFPLGYCPPTPPEPPKPHSRCSTPECDAIWGAQGCPDLNAYKPDLVRPPMLAAECPVPGSGCRTASSAAAVAPGAGKRVRAVAPGFEHTQVYHPLYLPSEWKSKSEKKYPVIVEYMGNGPFNDRMGDISTGRPEDSNLGWGFAQPVGSKYIWISMPFLSADLGNETEILTYWWGCPSSDAGRPCVESFDIKPTISYLHSALNQAFALYGGDPENVVITGWSRGAIATGAIGLYDDTTSKLFKAFVPYSHLDGDCGWVDDVLPSAKERWARLGGRPTLYLGECAVATQRGPTWLAKLGLNGSAAVSKMEFRTTGWANHNDAWVLRNSSARTYLRSWLDKVLN